MERISSFERVVGDISDSDKERALQAKAEIFNEQIFKDLEGAEREKTPEEIRIIDLANEATNEMRRKYGLEDFDIPEKNIHVILQEKWPDNKKGAFYTPLVQAIAIPEQPARIMFMDKVLHEMIHFKSYNAMQLTTAESPTLREHRMGLVVYTRDGENMYFTNLNEAVTEELTRRFAGKLFKDPLFARENSRTKEIARRYPNAVASSGEPLFDRDTFYAEVASERTWSEAIGRLFGGQEGVKEIRTGNFSYIEERSMLDNLLTKVLEGNSGQFNDKEEVFEVFARGMITGNIVPVGKLIDKTFGRGTFRRIGELDTDILAQEEFVDSL